MTDEPDISPFSAGLRCRCPRCGDGKLLRGFLQVEDQCERCGLSFSFADSGDGPAVFIMMIVGFIIVGAALAVEVAFSPSVLMHLLLWIPATLLLSFALLRPLKGLMIALQYKNDAHEAKWADEENKPNE
ncbi:DUF983 domain-containing protein [Maritalea mediterranea]|uniref:DUF983 domain-containing protein n=1 Tax=Maritalea mediterranea TaxID=2909667 RepID=A0ABS9E7Q4_9HYPH|nr:DUF983 domain-containing protein [Maritalea mediterranea]MCF4097800.1 DUF983 domain-containing protein [Maritalea mediterranea]